MSKSQVTRVAHIIGKWLGGGVEMVVMNYYRNIDKTKVQFDFICDEDSINIPREEIESLGGKVILIPPYQNLLKYRKELYKVLTENSYKIVHSHINTLSVFPLQIAKKANVPIRIAHSHSTSSIKEWKKNIIKQILRPFSRVYANHYMCCSECAGRWLFGNREYDKGNVHLLYNAINIDKFKFNENIRNEIRKELNISEDTLVIGHVGRFALQKNHSFLIDVFNEVHKKRSDAILLLVGQGALQKEIENKVQKLGLSENVKFLGQRDDVYNLYQAFDVFTLPSLYEGISIVGIEAQCAGLISIFADNITREVKLLETSKFIPINDYKLWAENIINIKKYKRENYDELVRSKNFDIKEEAKKLEQIYINY